MKNPMAFPSKIEGKNQDGSPMSMYHLGMDLRDYFAAKAKDDFDTLDSDTKVLIVGRPAPDPFKIVDDSDDLPFHNHVYYKGLDYMEWLAEGRAKWKMMQADAMLKYREL